MTRCYLRYMEKKSGNDLFFTMEKDVKRLKKNNYIIMKFFDYLILLIEKGF